jgi:hypothetical protein
MPKAQFFDAGFHSGRIIQYLAAIYGTLQQVVGELAQNFIDSEANQAHIILDLKERSLTSIDNGGGATRGEIQGNIQNLGFSRKPTKKGKTLIGRKGVGNLAPLALASDDSRWSITTHSMRGNEGRTWFEVSLDAKGLADKREVQFEKSELEPGFKLMDTYGNVIKGATTRVCITCLQPAALVEVRRMKNPATWLCQALAATYSASLLRTGIKIVVTVKTDDENEDTDAVRPQFFQGEPKKVVMTSRTGKEVVFDWYVMKTSPKKGGKLLFTHEDLVSFPMLNQKEVWGLVRPVFGSGFFQGYIRVPRGFCSLVPARTRFEPNQDLEDLIDVIARFHDQYAEPWLKEIVRENRESKSTKILKNVIDRIAPLFDEFPGLMDAFKGFDQGPGRPPANPDLFHLRTKKPGGSKPAKGKGGPEPKEGEDTGRTIGASSTGNVVKCSKGFSVKLVEADPTSPYGINWRIRIGDTGFEKGMMVLNRSHPDWVASEAQNEAAQDTYLTLLLLETMAASKIAEERAAIFKEEFETAFLRLRKPLVPRIPNVGKKSEVEEEEEE